MGGNQGFSKLVPKVSLSRKDFASSLMKDDLVVVDLSYLQHQANWKNLERSLSLFFAGVFKHDGDSGVSEFGSVDILVEQYVTELKLSLEPLKSTDAKLMVAFEGLAKKPGSLKRTKKRRRALNNAVRSIMRNRNNNKALKTLTHNMGRPPQWFTALVLAKLVEDGYSVVGSFDESVQADDVIFGIAQQHSSGRVFVIGSDYDFIALAPENSIHALYDSKREKLVTVADVLDRAEMSADQLFATYCVSGCDDIETKLQRIGFKKATQLVMSSSGATDVSSTSTPNITPLLSKLPSGESQKLKKEILALYKRIHESKYSCVSFHFQLVMQIGRNARHLITTKNDCPWLLCSLTSEKMTKIGTGLGCTVLYLFILATWSRVIQWHLHLQVFTQSKKVILLRVL